VGGTKVVELTGTTQKGKERILVVEDMPEILKIARLILEREGYQVFTATDGDEALKILSKEDHIDLLFSDIVMPGNTNGYELAEIATANTPHLKVLLTTGYAGGITEDGTQGRFTSNMLDKPYLREDLIRRVQLLLANTSLEEQIQKVSNSTPTEAMGLLAIGVKAIDADHENLFGILSKCKDISKSDTQSDELNLLVLDELLDYVAYHFKREEAVMVACNYPSLDIHKHVHKVLAQQVADKKEMFRQGNLSPTELFEFLTGWLVHHIQGMDRDIASFCEGNLEDIEREIKGL
tara:strand:+ start:11552 stop:12430 length:879 start_codon:yes stop_codon:yes gene_type:complete